MPKLPSVPANKLIKVLIKLEFKETRQTGSHKIYKHQDGRRTSVPYHSTHDIGKGLLREILNQIHITPEEFIKLLKK